MYVCVFLGIYLNIVAQQLNLRCINIKKAIFREVMILFLKSLHEGLPTLRHVSSKYHGLDSVG